MILILVLTWTPALSADEVSIDVELEERSELVWPVRGIAPFWSRDFDGDGEREVLSLYRLPRVRSKSFRLRIPLGRVGLFYMSANLSSELPRLDALDFEKYFTAGLAFRVWRQVSIFVEDFQRANGVIGTEIDPDQKIPEFSWDGHQITAGVRFAMLERRVELQAAPVFYVLSENKRADNVGVMSSLRLIF